MKTALFICTHNSARSQLAEGITNHFFGKEWRAFSAGTEKTFVKPNAVKALEEIQIDASNLYSKTIDEFKGESFDLVVTVCSSAAETCPFFPGKKIIHKSFEDPSNCQGDDKAKLDAFRKTRDEIKNWLTLFLPTI